MKYGYFDQKNKEYVIVRPDTPTPWIKGGHGVRNKYWKGMWNAGLPVCFYYQPST